jgi:hypothetical protein
MYTGLRIAEANNVMVEEFEEEEMKRKVEAMKNKT